MKVCQPSIAWVLTLGALGCSGATAESGVDAAGNPVADGANEVGLDAGTADPHDSHETPDADSSADPHDSRSTLDADSSTDAPEADAPEADERADASTCDRKLPSVKVGCTDATSLKVDGTSSGAGSYSCAADEVGSIVRVRTCVSMPHTPCIEDSGGAYCAVVDLETSTLASLSAGTTLVLDGTSTFSFPSPTVFRVNPDDVVYAPAQTADVKKAWMEKKCFCTPTPPLTASQVLRGTLRISDNSAGRLSGQLTLSATGTVSPTNWINEEVVLDAFFDVPITPGVAGDP